MNVLAERVQKSESQVDCEGWRKINCQWLTAQCCDAVGEFEKNVVWPVSILFTSDKNMAKLNSEFRGINAPTNVLSFQAGEPGALDVDYLGDIAVAFETCNREALEKEIPLQDHAAHLLVHGMLHLLGYDHETDKEAEIMESRETAILKSMGIADPYDSSGSADDER